VNSLTLSIPCGRCHSVFIDDFKVYYYFVLAGDLWSNREIAFFTIPCVGPDYIFAFHLMRRSWIHWHCRFHGVPVTQYSLTISRSTVTLFLPAIYGSALTECFFHFHASAMTLFLLSTWCFRREFIDAVDSMLYLSLSIHWQFQGLQLLCFCRRFMDQPWHSFFDNTMRRPWFYFFYRFDASIVNSWTLSIPCGSCHSVFFDDFKVYCYSPMAGDLWIIRDIAFLSIPCVGHDSIFSIDLMRRSWIHWRCRFHAVAITQYSLTISRSTVTLFLPAIYGSAVTECFFHFHASTMTLFLLSTWWFRREFINAVDSMVYLSLSIRWRFQGLRLLCFCRRFMDQPWHSIFDNSMRWPWLYFFYRFDV
jgi:hypothetical protein